MVDALVTKGYKKACWPPCLQGLIVPSDSQQYALIIKGFKAEWLEHGKEHLEKALLSDTEPWATALLSELACRLDVTEPKNDFVRVTLKDIKVEWSVYDCQSEQWFCRVVNARAMENNGVQELVKMEKEPSWTEYVDMTINDFVIFKAAGKRHGSDKDTRYGEKTIDRRRLDKTNSPA